MVQYWFGARGTTTCILFLCKPEVGTDAQLQWVNVTLDHQMESAAKNTLLEVTVPSQGWKRETPALLIGSTSTVPSKLVQCIWDLDFIELEELLPSNKIIQALEEGVISRPDGSSLGLANPSQLRVAGISTWS